MAGEGHFLGFEVVVQSEVLRIHLLELTILQTVELLDARPHFYTLKNEAKIAISEVLELLLVGGLGVEVGEKSLSATLFLISFTI